MGRTSRRPNGSKYLWRHCGPTDADRTPQWHDVGKCRAYRLLHKSTKLATALHLAIQTKMERDFLDTTPERIREMVCSDVSPGEFASIRRRVYDTVILGKGLSQAQEDDANVVTARTQVPDVEKVRTVRTEGMPIVCREGIMHVPRFLATVHSAKNTASFTHILHNIHAMHTFIYSLKSAKCVKTMIKHSLYWIARMAT